MRMSRLFGKTLRNAPADADTANHQLMLRAGLVQQLAAGIYSYLPTGWKVMRKIEQIIREEMDRAGGQEVIMPVVQPAELWQESGRIDTMGDVLFHPRRKTTRLSTRFAMPPSCGATLCTVSSTRLPRSRAIESIVTYTGASA